MFFATFPCPNDFICYYFNYYHQNRIEIVRINILHSLHNFVVSSYYYYSYDELPYRDWYPVIRRKVREKWACEWREVRMNKLRLIKETVDPWSSSNNPNRTTSKILARLRTGHTKLTHQYLMERNMQPYCQDCLVPLTIKHTLAECPSFCEERRRNYPGCSGYSADEMLREMLAEKDNSIFDTGKLVKYLKETDTYLKII